MSRPFASTTLFLTVPLAMVAIAPLAAQEAAPAAPATRPAMPTTAPGTPNPRLIGAGTYATDPSHTLVGWRVTHFGFNDYFGQFGNATGTLTLDPRRPNDARVELDIPIDSLSVVNAQLRHHLTGNDFFAIAANPTAHFVSTRVRVTGTRAAITGNLTIKGQTHPITLNAQFQGAGTNPFNNKATIGFNATGRMLRSQFGLGYGVPLVSDAVDLTISVAFEKQG